MINIEADFEARISKLESDIDMLKELTKLLKNYVEKSNDVVDIHTRMLENLDARLKLMGNENKEV